MINEIKLIYLLALKQNLNLAEIAGKEGWQPIIRTMVADCALKIVHLVPDSIMLMNETHKFIRNFLIISDRGGSKKKSSQNNQ